MKKKHHLSIAVCLALGLGVGMAAHANDDDVTLDVVELGDTPENVVNRIELPAPASDQARESAARGLATANDARELRGNETAVEARELGREFGERMAGQARDGNVAEQVRESVGAGRDIGPSQRPSVPGRP
jgi:hypothetical protein